MMEKTLTLIDTYAVRPGHALTTLQKHATQIDERLKVLEAAKPKATE